jgi:uncharacterized damage-inducible protein DinB
MKDQIESNVAELQVQQIINQVINFWLNQNKAIDSFFALHQDDIYLREVAPGRNTARFLLGHLIAMSDAMLPLFGLGDKLFPELSPLATVGEDAVPFPLSLPELKMKWKNLNQVLESKFKAMTVAEWLGRHNSVSEEDFAADPQRNKLNVLMGRAAHQNYHRGQLVFLNERAPKA